jgi:hypothetical protein
LAEKEGVVDVRLSFDDVGESVASCKVLGFAHVLFAIPLCHLIDEALVWKAENCVRWALEEK